MSKVPIGGLTVSAYTVPTETPESDGTLEWNATTIVIVELQAGGARGIGYTYGHAVTATLIDQVLAPVVLGRDAMDVQGANLAMRRALRNIGRPGIGSMAVSAVDIALWDCKARLLEQPLCTLLGMSTDSVEAYGSGGFTSYTVAQLEHQLADWIDHGMRAVKMKVGRRPTEDVDRVHAVRHAMGDDFLLFVDANGAYDRKQALDKAYEFADFGVTWFEEPVTSDDVDGLRLLRDRGPAPMDVAAGEYCYDAFAFERLMGAVDVLQADATRCGGITGFLLAGALCEARAMPLSAHTAPSAHAAVACALPAVRHVEYFFDHARVERLLFEGVPEPNAGRIGPDLERAGLGIELKRADAERYAA